MRLHFLLSAATLALVAPTVHAAASPSADSALSDAQTGHPVVDTPIIVTATPFRHTADETPAISAHVDAEQIRAAGGASIADALRDVPGISLSGFAVGASRPIIRGMDANRVRLLENGTSASDVSDIGPDHGIPIDPLSARSIEVVRGAATLRYGSQAIGGVVNTINNRVPTSQQAQKLQVEGNLAYNSVAKGLESSGLVDVQLGSLVLHADGFRRHQGDYETPDGAQSNSFFRGRGGALGGSYFLKDGESRVGLAAVHYDAQYGIPAEDAYIDMRQTKLMSRNLVAIHQGLLKSLTVDGSYSDYQHSEREPDGTPVATFKNRESNLRGELLFNRLGMVRNMALGVEFIHRDFSALGEAIEYLLPATAQTTAAYAFSEIELAPRWHVEASGRVEHVRLTGTNAGDAFVRQSYTPVSGALGLLYDLGRGVSLGGTLSSTGRAPAMTEMFARGAHDGPMTYEIGSSDLRVERANAVEASLRWRHGPFRFEGSVYHTWYSRYIYGALSGQTCDEQGQCAPDDSGELREVFYRQQGAKFRGAEAEARLDVYRGSAGKLALRLLGDMTRATLDDGSNVPRIPPYRLGGGVNWHGKATHADITLNRYARQTRFGQYDTPTAGYTMLNAQISWQPWPAMPGVEVSLVGQNLANATQRLATAFNKDEVMMPGRSLRVILRVANF